MAPPKHPRSSFQPFSEHAERAFSSVSSEVDHSSALVVLDTNVLLAPYRTSAAALDEIKRIYAKLRNDSRLIVPAQVAREFAKNRPNLVAALHKLVRDARSVAINGRYEAPPAVRGMREHVRAAGELEKAQLALRAYRKALDELADKIGHWHQTDPVLDVYGQLFDSATVCESSISSEVLEDIRKSRYELRMPPGYKDKGKDDGGGGDLIIWLTILEVAAARARDAIFVTEETKEDWFHRVDGEPIFLRYELAEEYRAVTGRAIAHMRLADFLESFGAKDAVVQEVKEQERLPRWPHIAHVHLEEQVLARLVDVVSPDVVVSTQNGFPDIVIDLPSERLGLEVSLTRDASYLRISAPILRALQLGTNEFKEVAIAFIAEDEQAARSLETRFAEERFLGRGVSAIVLHSTPVGLRTLVNQSYHPVFQRAFPLS